MSSPPVPPRATVGERASSVATGPDSARATPVDVADELAGALDVDGNAQPTRPLAIVARRRLGLAGFDVYPVALGASAFGWTVSRDDAFAILDRFWAYGGNLVDTADSYADGASEQAIGEWLSRRRNRDSLVISTKVGKGHDSRGLSSVSIVRAVDASLRRLQTDHLDVLSFHLDDAHVPLEDSLATVEWLMHKGKVRALGAVDFSSNRLLEARILSSAGLPKILVAGNRYNLMHRGQYEADTQLAVTAQGIAVMPCSDLGTRVALEQPATESGALAIIARAADQSARRSSRILSVLARVAAELGVHPAAVAVAWLLTKRNVVAPVVGFTSVAEVDSVVAAASIRLTRAQVRELDRVSA